ncbi:hypothetical protein FQA39_LY18390 [Lamprigera yunnana]|nr:hypothetical protein FQA39_LY18390 [Lamprigera yunnana]
MCSRNETKDTLAKPVQIFAEAVSVLEDSTRAEMLTEESAKRTLRNCKGPNIPNPRSLHELVIEVLSLLETTFKLLYGSIAMEKKPFVPYPNLGDKLVKNGIFLNSVLEKKRHVENYYSVLSQLETTFKMLYGSIAMGKKPFVPYPNLGDKLVKNGIVLNSVLEKKAICTKLLLSFVTT